MFSRRDKLVGTSVVKQHQLTIHTSTDIAVRLLMMIDGEFQFLAALDQQQDHTV